MGPRDKSALFEALKATIEGLKSGYLAFQFLFSERSKISQLQSVVCFDAGRINRLQLPEAIGRLIDEPRIEILDCEPQRTAIGFVPKRSIRISTKRLSVVLSGTRIKTLFLLAHGRKKLCRLRVKAHFSLQPSALINDVRIVRRHGQPDFHQVQVMQRLAQSPSTTAIRAFFSSRPAIRTGMRLTADSRKAAPTRMSGTLGNNLTFPQQAFPRIRFA